MGAWGPGPLDSHGAWDFVNRLASAPDPQQHGLLRNTFDGELDAQAGVDVDDATAVIAAAVLVALCRDPHQLDHLRTRVLEQTRASHDIDSLSALVGDLRACRAAGMARTALRALDRVTTDSDLTILANPEELADSLEPIRAVLAAPVRPWREASVSRDRPKPLYKTWTPGSIISIDLGDGHRVYAQQLATGRLACYDQRQTDTEPIPGVADIAARLVAFTTNVNTYYDRPPGWLTIGPAPADAVLKPPPLFKQDIGDPHQCQLIVDGDWNNPVPATQQDCVGLEVAGAGFMPDKVEERLRHHFAGVPWPDLADVQVRISHCLVHVTTRDRIDVVGTLTNYTAPDPDHLDRTPLYPFHTMPTFAAGFGPGRDDLVMFEIDEACADTYRVEPRSIAYDPTMPEVRWVPHINAVSIIAVHGLTPIGNGYATTNPWMPIHP